VPHYDRLRTATINTSNYPFSESIFGCECSKKFTTPTFHCYSGLSDPIQHLRKYQDKMVVYARNDPILCRIFPSSLKGVVSFWFYFLSPRSIHNFKDLTKLFLSQYSSRQEFKQNNHHHLYVKMRWQSQGVRWLLPESTNQST